MENSLEYRLFGLLASKLSGNAGSEDLAELDAILNIHPEYQFLHDLIIHKSPVSSEDSARAERAFTVHAAKLGLTNPTYPQIEIPELIIPRKKKTSYIPYIAAAAILLIITSAIFFYLERKPNFGTPNEIATTNRSRSAIKLPDGSSVILNANSTISYSPNFKGNTREVQLNGEAFFDVVHDKKRPFIIHTSAGDIKVLGTAFNVRCFKDGTFETALIRGKVAIHLNKKGNKDFVLEPGQKLIANNSNIQNADSAKVVPVIKADSLIAETSWTKGRLVYVDKPLGEIAIELERIFGVNIIFKSDAVRQYRYTGVFDDSNLNQIIEILVLAKKFHYQQNKNQILID